MESKRTPFLSYDYDAPLTEAGHYTPKVINTEQNSVHNIKTIIFKRLYEDYLELGYTEEEAATKAYEEFNSRIPPHC